MDWPREVFSAALLRGLDERGRSELTQSGTLRRLHDGEALYRRGDKGAALYVVASGELSLEGLRRGEDEPRRLRLVAAGDSLGEEASIGASWRATATAVGDAVVAEIPVAMFRRALVRAGGHEVADRFERRLRRRATAELLATIAFTASLAERDREMLLDGAEHHELERGEAVYRSGEPPSHLWLVADGMVQLQTEDDERLRVRAYLVRGDFFGDEELLSGEPRRETAVASGDSLLVSIDAAVARTVMDRNPEVLRKLRRVAHAHAGEQRQAVAQGKLGQTQHAFRDLYRLQVARSLLVIDLDSCVRCGHCAWSCEALHGVARLVRRGDKIVTRVGSERAAPSPLLLPNSCQHCENPACMPDCPTGAIGRDPRGEIYIRDELCTGCGACAKGCPWDNIQIVPRPPGAPAPPASGGRRFGELAVKCDLCRDYDGPACVKACPTEAIFRLNPAEELPDVARVLRVRPTGDQARREPRRAPLMWGLSAISLAIAIAGIALHARGVWVPWRGAGWLAGVIAALGIVLAAAYAVPKRLVRLWSRRRERGLRDNVEPPAPARSLVRPQLTLHMVIGMLSAGVVFAHGGWGFGGGSGGALLWALTVSSAIGGLAALSYALVPRRLSRIERQAALPEDFAPARRDLTDRLYGGITGRSEVVKKLFERVLVPYMRTPLGWAWLVASGRTLAEEQARLEQHIAALLQGRGRDRLAGLDQLVRLAVELRALTAQRALTWSLRAWLPLHVVSAGACLAMLAIHLWEVL